MSCGHTEMRSMVGEVKDRERERRERIRRMSDEDIDGRIVDEL